MPKVDLTALPVQTGSNYLPPYDRRVAVRGWRAVAAAGGITQFGANLVTLPPGAWSSQRHWHSHEDEMLVMMSGEAVLVENECETRLVAGDVACFPAGVANAHHLQNRSSGPCSFLAVGTDFIAVDHCHYPDIDMHLDPDGFRRKTDGER